MDKLLIIIAVYSYRQALRGGDIPIFQWGQCQTVKSITWKSKTIMRRRGNQWNI